MLEPRESNAQTDSGYLGHESSTLILLLILSRGKGKLIGGTLLGLLLGACLAFALHPTFTATATILPPQAPQSSLSSLMGQLGSLSALGGGSSLLKSPADLYVGILQSRTIADQIVERFHLQTQWHLQSQNDVRKKLSTRVKFEAAKNGMIDITVNDKDPQQASAIANSFVEALNSINSRLAISEASQRRLFFEQQLSEEKSALAAAEEDLKDTQQKTGLLNVGGQAEQAIRSIAQTRAEIASREVKLQSMRTYETDLNPEIIEIQQQISTLRGQLTELQNNQSKLVPGDTQIAANQVPAGTLEYTRKLREVKYHDTLLNLLSRQYEAARIDEAKSAPIIQVVDRAVPPDKKSGPPRLLIMLGMAVAGFMAASGWLCWKHFMEQVQQKPDLASVLGEIQNNLRWRRSR
jgi:tyrosine-protein kinase Etk/Wzc